MNLKNYSSVGNNIDEKNKHFYYAQKAKVGIVEIGVLNGETTEIFCKANKDVSITGIDPIISDSMNANLIGSEDKIKQLEKQYPNFSFIKDYSFNVAKYWEKSIDYLFIDGDHTYEAVKQDFDSWFPFVTKDGIIVLHDSACNRGGPHFWFGPSKLADELIQDSRLEYMETIYTMTVFKKN
jgi:hypothetical protein